MKILDPPHIKKKKKKNYNNTNNNNNNKILVLEFGVNYESLID